MVWAYGGSSRWLFRGPSWLTRLYVSSSSRYVPRPFQGKLLRDHEGFDSGRRRCCDEGLGLARVRGLVNILLFLLSCCSQWLDLLKLYTICGTALKVTPLLLYCFLGVLKMEWLNCISYDHKPFPVISQTCPTRYHKADGRNDKNTTKKDDQIRGPSYL